MFFSFVKLDESNWATTRFETFWKKTFKQMTFREPIYFLPYDIRLGYYEYGGLNYFDELDKITKSMDPLLHLILTGGEPYLRHGLDQIVKIFYKNKIVGQTTVGAFSPYFGKGIGYALFNYNNNWIEKKLYIKDHENNLHDCQIVTLPFFDESKKIPKLVNANLS